MLRGAVQPVGPAAHEALRLSVTGMSFRFPGGRDPILRGVDLTVTAGQVLGILGPNGSGKSTLLNALLGVASGERHGTVRLNGKEPLARSQVGYATQRVALYRQLTVVENLRHAARTSLPRRAVGAAVDAAVDEFGLEPVTGTAVHRLSGGWERLTHIAASFVHRPVVRLLDEPTTALDFDTRARLVGLVHRWRDAGSVLLVTSHYPEDIEEMCSHTLVLHNGTVARYGPMHELIASHRREITVDVLAPSGGATLRADAPATLRDLHDTVTRWAAAGDPADVRVRGISVSRGSLREMLAADPQLRGFVDDRA